MYYIANVKSFLWTSKIKGGLAIDRMYMVKKKRVLNVVTSHETLGKTGYPAGLWLSELTHPYFELADNGIEVDIASPKGGKAPIDPFSDPCSPNSIEKGMMITLQTQGFLLPMEWLDLVPFYYNL